MNSQLTRRYVLKFGLAAGLGLGLPFPGGHQTRANDSVDQALPFRSRKKFKTVLGSRMAYVESGRGNPIVFLHGNPTSSFLWRNVLPHLEGLGRCIAPDLIGMGDSDKLTPSVPGRYAFAEHRNHLDALLEKLGVRKNVVFVVHDWGGCLGFDWARRHPDAVKGIAFMETFVVSQQTASAPEHALKFFNFFRTEKAEKAVLENNMFVEKVLLAQFPNLSDEEKNEYRRPFSTPGEGRRPTLDWPRQVPIDGQPADVHDMVTAYLDWLSKSTVPKLFVNGDPGGLIVGPLKEKCRTWPATEEVVVKGGHYLPEESPHDIGKSVAAWFRKLKNR